MQYMHAWFIEIAVICGVSMCPPLLGYYQLVNAHVDFTYCIQGFGMLLMEEAERIAREEHGSFKISVISGKTVAKCVAI